MNTVRFFAGRLSKEDIERVTKVAEKFRDDDAKERRRSEAKNELENFALQILMTINDEKFKNKISDADKKKLEAKNEDCLEWLKNNQVSAI